MTCDAGELIKVLGPSDRMTAGPVSSTGAMGNRSALTALYAFG